MSIDTIIATIAQVIIGTEGAKTSNNNPGNLRNWDPSLPKDNRGFDIFPTYAAGYNALLRQIQLDMVTRGMTIQEAMNKYAPAKDNNDPVAYAKRIANAIGLTPDSRITDAVGGGSTYNPPEDATLASIMSDVSPSDNVVQAGLFDWSFEYSSDSQLTPTTTAILIGVGVGTAWLLAKLFG